PGLQQGFAHASFCPHAAPLRYGTLMYTTTSNAQRIERRWLRTRSWRRRPDETRPQRSVARSRGAAAASRRDGDAHAVGGVRAREPLRCAAAAEGDGPASPATDVHALSGGDRQRRVGEYRQALG